MHVRFVERGMKMQVTTSYGKKNVHTLTSAFLLQIVNTGRRYTKKVGSYKQTGKEDVVLLRSSRGILNGMIITYIMTEHQVAWAYGTLST